MGDIGEDMAIANPILPPVEGLPHRVKSNALHIEDTTSILQELSRVASKPQDTMLSSVQDIKPIDSAMASNAPSSIASHAPEETEEKDAISDDTSSDDLSFSRSREPLTQTNTRDPDQPSRAPSPLRLYNQEPDLETFDGPNAGKAAADWKEKFIPIIHTHTAAYTLSERANFFDELLEDDKERYLPALAAYYFAHPENLPDRETSSKAQKKIDLGFKDNPRIWTKQKQVFKGWQWPEPDAKRVKVQERVGPKGEVVPGEIPAECEHCVKEEKRKRLRKRASTILRPVTAPFRRRRATVQDGGKQEKRSETWELEQDDAVEDEEEKSTEESDAKSSQSKSSTPSHTLPKREAPATQCQEKERTTTETQAR